jgi:hypothetical protein
MEPRLMRVDSPADFLPSRDVAMQANSRAELLVLKSLLSLLAEKGLLTREEVNGVLEDAAAALRSEKALGDADALDEISRSSSAQGPKR